MNTASLPPAVSLYTPSNLNFAFINQAEVNFDIDVNMLFKQSLRKRTNLVLSIVVDYGIMKRIKRCVAGIALNREMCRGYDVITISADLARRGRA